VRRLARLLRTRPDSGFSIVEVSIAMGLFALLIGITLTSVISARRVFAATDDEATGQTDVRTAVERLGRDIRSARGVDTGATSSRLDMWVDRNSDYKRTADEIVYWQLSLRPDGQYDVRRSSDGTSAITARTIIDQLAFCYRAAANGPCLPTPLSAADARRVTVVETTMRYDARVGSGSNARQLVVAERLRNVG
jgi:Tfp pilus assembly protein PilW